MADFTRFHQAQYAYYNPDEEESILYTAIQRLRYWYNRFLGTPALFALVLGILIYHQDRIRIWYAIHFPPEASFLESLMALWAQTIETVRAYIQIGQEWFTRPARNHLRLGITNREMPGLVGDETNGTVSATAEEELVPAFLHKSDYPPGWKVYHPALGVVDKQEADAFDESNRQRNLSNDHKEAPAARRLENGNKKQLQPCLPKEAVNTQNQFVESLTV